MDPFTNEQIEILACRVVELLSCRMNVAIASKNDRNKNEVEPELVGRHELAKKMKIGIATVDRWVKNGAIPSYRIGNRRLFSRLKSLKASGNLDRDLDLCFSSP